MHFCIYSMKLCIEGVNMSESKLLKSAKNKKKRTKAELSIEIWNRIKEIIDERRLSQVQLQKLCLEQGFDVGQPEISKLYSGKILLTLYQLNAFSAALGVPAEQFLTSERGIKKIHVSGKSFITDPEQDVFEGFMGMYYTAFHSTSPFDDKIIHGKLLFFPSEKGGICEALFELKTGEKNEKGHDIVKRYHGQLIISSRLRVGYCLLINDRIGEICSLEFRHRSFLVKQVECRLGMVLTTSSGEVKKPIVHKIFLSRSLITDEMLDWVVPFLKMEDEEILISKRNLIRLNEENKTVDFEFTALLENGEMEEYIYVTEDLIRRRRRQLSQIELAKVYSLIRKNSEGNFSFSLSEKEDSRAYDVIRKIKSSSDSP